MRYMVIERFGDVRAIYQRLHERGRMMPDGLRYVDSWVSEDLDRCYQLMDADRPESFEAWIAHWDDLMEFEIVRVLSSGEASAKALETGAGRS